MKRLWICLFAALSSVALASSVSGQTGVFTYQGNLMDGATAANGTYNMQFSLYDLSMGGMQQGSTITNTSVSVSNGVFTVQLDFSPATPFATGADRWLEIAVKKPADPGYTTLAPRQQMTSSPYSIRTLSASAADSLSATCVLCVTDAKINTVAGTKVTGTVANATNATTATTADSLSATCVLCVTDAKINTVAGTKVTGTVANATNATTATTAGNVTGTVAIANGGTGATSAVNARTNLGLGTLATVSPTGTANATTFLRGDNSWTAVSGGAGAPIFATRATNVIVNSATFVDVITINLEANKTYSFEGAVYGQRVGAVSGNANLRVTYTGAATTDLGIDVGANTVLLGTVFNSTSFDFEANGGGNQFGNGVQNEFPVSGIIRSTSAGTMALQIARGATNTTVDLNVREGTYLLARPLN
jgi:hypothetical protein